MITMGSVKNRGIFEVDDFDAQENQVLAVVKPIAPHLPKLDTDSIMAMDDPIGYLLTEEHLNYGLGLSYSGYGPKGPGKPFSVTRDGEKSRYLVRVEGSTIMCNILKALLWYKKKEDQEEESA